MHGRRKKGWIEGKIRGSTPLLTHHNLNQHMVLTSPRQIIDIGRSIFDFSHPCSSVQIQIPGIIAYPSTANFVRPRNHFIFMSDVILFGEENKK